MRVLISIAFLLAIAFLSCGQTGSEKLRVFWPDDYKWQTISNTDDSINTTIQMIPDNESREKWTLLATMTTTKNLVAPDLNQIIQSFSDAAVQESSKAKVTILEKFESGKNFWVIMKIETSEFPNDPNPESNFWYIKQGNTNLFTVYLTKKEKTFSKEFVEKWSKVFKESKLVYE